MSQDNNWHLQETYKGLISLSVEALKMLALVNGGAAIAILTYIGNLASHQQLNGPLPRTRFALVCFSLGVFAVALAFIVAYVAQGMLYREERPGGSRSGRHSLVVSLGIFLAVVSALSFAVGCISAANALAP